MSVYLPEFIKVAHTNSALRHTISGSKEYFLGNCLDFHLKNIKQQDNICGEVQKIETMNSKNY